MLQNWLSGYEKSALKIFLLFSLILGFKHSIVDAILILKTNVKAKHFFKDYMYFETESFKTSESIMSLKPEEFKNLKI